MELMEKAENVRQQAAAAVNSPGAMLIPDNVRRLVVEMAALVESMAGKIEGMEQRQQKGREAARRLLIEVDREVLPQWLCEEVLGGD